MAGRLIWHRVCFMSGMRHLDGKEYKDLKELAWDAYGRDSHEAEMAFRYEMETMWRCLRSEIESNGYGERENQEEDV
jgi:hypothetical protein